MRPRYSGLILSAAVAALYSPALHATTVRQASLEQLVRGADLVFHGVVGEVNEALAPTAAGPFRTKVEFEVLENIKGGLKSGQIFSMVVPGGRGHGKTMVIPGMPRFKKGEQLILLLEKTRFGYIPSGLAQGVLWVRARGKTPVIERDLEGLHWVNEKMPKSIQMPLASMLEYLRGEVKKGALR